MACGLQLQHIHLPGRHPHATSSLRLLPPVLVYEQSTITIAIVIVRLFINQTLS